MRGWKSWFWEWKMHAVYAMLNLWRRMHVVSCGQVTLFKVFHHDGCMMPAYVRHTGSPSCWLFSTAFPPPPHHHLPRWSPSAWDVSNTVMRVLTLWQQLASINDSRWMLVFLRWGRWKSSAATYSDTCSSHHIMLDVPTSGIRLVSTESNYTRCDLSIMSWWRWWRQLIGVKCTGGSPSKATASWGERSFAS